MRSWGLPRPPRHLKTCKKLIQTIKNLKNDSLVSLAFKEQSKMNLDWYKKIEPILSVDPTFEMDHVTAYNLKKSKATKSNNNSQDSRYNFLLHLTS